LNKAALKLIRHCPTKHLVQKICYELFNLGLIAKYSVQEKLKYFIVLILKLFFFFFLLASCTFLFLKKGKESQTNINKKIRDNIFKQQKWAGEAYSEGTFKIEITMTIKNCIALCI